MIVSTKPVSINSLGDFELYLLKSIVSVLGAIFCYFVIREYRTLGKPNHVNYEKRIKRLEFTNWKAHYRTRITILLWWIEKIFGPSGTVHEKNFLWFFRIQPWTALSYERCLALSVAYSIFFLVGTWIIFNSGSLGNVIPIDSMQYWQRMIPAIIAIATFAYVYLKKGIGIATVYSIVTFTGSFAIFTENLVAGTVAIAGAISFAIRPSLTITPSTAVAGSGALAAAILIADYYHSPLAFFIAIVFVVFFSATINKLRLVARNRNLLSYFWLCTTIFLFVMLLTSVWFRVHQIGDLPSRDTITTLLLLCLLPLTNASLDWLSLGLTRGLLNIAANKNHPWFIIVFIGLADVIFALVLLFFVTATTISGIHIVNLVSGEELVELIKLNKQLENREAVKENLWIWCILASTLIPTAIHFVSAAPAIALRFTQPKARQLATKLKKPLKIVKDLKKHGKYQEADYVPGESDEQLFAFIYLWIAPVLFIAISLVALTIALIAALSIIPDYISWILNLIT